MTASVTLRIADELRLFLRDRWRTADPLVVGVDDASTVGHLVQSVGVPLTEVGELRVDGAPATHAGRPVAGSTVRALPVVRPQATATPPRFLLDVHLGKLARQLRILGLDTVYDRDAPDPWLTEQAAAQQRILLTQDRGLLMRRHLPGAGGHAGEPTWTAAYVHGKSAAEQLADVLDRFAPPLAPWTRCAACNGVLAPVPKAEIEDRLEPGTRRQFDDFARCPDCDRVYWHGAHTPGLGELVARYA